MAEKMTGARLFAQHARGVRRHARLLHGRGPAARARGDGRLRASRACSAIRRKASRTWPTAMRASRAGRACAWRSRSAPRISHPACRTRISGTPPVVAITGRHVAPFQHRNAYQEVEHAPLYQAVTKFHASIDTLEQIPHLMRQAFREATTGTPRPVHLDMAGFTGDAITPLEGDVRRDRGRSAHALSRVPAAARSGGGASAPLPRSGAASRPVIVADRGAAICGARDALRAARGEDPGAGRRRRSTRRT